MQKHQIQTKRLLKDFLYIIVGCFLTAAGLVMFTVPNHIAPGGTSGLGTALAVFIPLSIGVLTWIVNLPILMMAWKAFGKGVMIKTLVAASVLSFYIDGLTPFLPTFTDNKLMAAVLGGILIGIGIGILFLDGMSMGGTDQLSVILGRVFVNISVGNIMMVCDGLVVVFAAIVFRDLEVFLYSIITVFVASQSINIFMEGMNCAKVIFIITNKGETIADALNQDNENGCTLIPAFGTYSKEERQVLMAVVRPNTAVQTLEIAKNIDAEMFSFMTSAAEVHGKGFKFYKPDGTGDQR